MGDDKMKFCENCGEELKEEQDICLNCGVKIEQKDEEIDVCILILLLVLFWPAAIVYFNFMYS